MGAERSGPKHLSPLLLPLFPPAPGPPFLGEEMKQAAALLLLAASAGSVGSAVAARPPVTPLIDRLDPLTDVSTQCRWASPVGTSFDVSSMTKASNGAYTVGDMRDPTLSYVFNVCGACGKREARRG
jgi:hypothetical protein